MSSASHTSTGEISLSPMLAWPVVGAAATLAAIGAWLFWDFLSRQVLWAIRHEADWGHTLLIPAIAGYLIYHNREQLSRVKLRTNWLGLFPMIVGVGWYMLVSLTPALQNHNLQAMGVWLTLVGLTLLFCGVRAMAWLWFPLVYLLLFGQSISDRAMALITHELQDIAAWGSYMVMALVGFDVERAGNKLTVFDSGGVAHPVNIAEACSGMRMLMAFLALGVALAYTGFQRLWQRTTLVIFAVPTAVIVNILRVITLSVLALLDSDFAAGDFHTFVGLVWLVPALLLYLGEMWVIRHIVVDREGRAGV